MRVRAGDLPDRGVIQRATSTQDSLGQPIESWADLVTVWVRVEALTGREAEVARQLVATATTKVTIRDIRRSYLITPKDRVVLANPTRTLGIVDIQPDDIDKNRLVLICEDIK